MSDKQLVNIPTDVQDAHYRYRMERMNLKVEGRGNGIKTVVTNMSTVASHLKVPVSYPTKYFGLELGAQSKFDKSNDRAIVNGQFDYAQFETLLNNFIKKFVCCYRCHLPECSMTIDKHENIKLTCSACGHISTVPPAEKMATFIIKHPPKNKKAHVQNQQTTAATDVVELARRAVEDDEDWDPDVSDEAVRQRREEEGLQGRLAELAMDSDDEGKKKKKKKSKKDDEEVDEEDGDDDVVPPVEVLKNFLNVKKDATTKQILAAVNKIKEDYELSDKDAVCLMYESFFDKNIEKQVARFAPVLKPYVSSSTTAQKIVLGYTEELCGVKEPSKLLSKVSLILKAFYDQDLLDEEVILEWHSKKKSKFVKSSVVVKVKEAAKPFVEWLSNAEEEDDSEEEN